MGGGRRRSHDNRDMILTHIHTDLMHWEFTIRLVGLTKYPSRCTHRMPLQVVPSHDMLIQQGPMYHSRALINIVPDSTGPNSRM